MPAFAVSRRTHADCQILTRSIGARGGKFGSNAVLYGGTHWGFVSYPILMHFKLEARRRHALEGLANTQLDALKAWSYPALSIHSRTILSSSCVAAGSPTPMPALKAGRIKGLWQLPRLRSWRTHVYWCDLASRGDLGRVAGGEPSQMTL